MKAQLKKRPQSTKIRAQSGQGSRRGNPVQGEEYFKKGKVEQLGGNHLRAIELYSLAATCKSGYFQAYCNMGYCYRALGKFGEAKRSYQSALASNPHDPITHYNLANLYRVIGQNDLAVEQYSQVVALRQQGVTVGSLYLDSLVNIGICYKNKGEIDEAIRVNRKVLEVEPTEASALFNLAVCLLNSIEDKNSPLFLKFYRERASEAQALFQGILNKTPDSIMAQFCLAKASVILEPSQDNVEAVIGRLKELLGSPRCDIKDEINQEIGRCLNLLRKFDESAKYYEHSVGGLTRRVSHNRQENKIDNIFESFSQEEIPEDPLDNHFLTEAKGVALIEAGNFKLAEKRISELPEGLLKHTLRLILELKIAEEDPDRSASAIAVYKQHFNRSEEDLPFDRLSVEAHKAIGKVLSLQQDYEESIKHYEYISQRIKGNRGSASAKLHSELGERFEEVGNRQKALEEYKKGIEIEPDNYSLSYAMGYCLYENGSYDEARATFEKIIQRVRSDPALPNPTKELYETDCSIICAICTTQYSPATFELFTSAFKKLQKLQAEESAVEMEEENLLLFYIRISELYEEKVAAVLPHDPAFREAAEMLIQIYQSLLELACCPDRNEVLTNSATLAYQLAHYAAAAEAYSQVLPPLLPALSLALAYAHLLEPSLALKYAHQACQLDPKDRINAFCREVLEWIYLNARDGEWSKQLPVYREDLFYVRNEFGVGLLDKLTEAINHPDFQPKNTEKLLASLAKHHERIKSHHHLINAKLQALQALEKRYHFQAPPAQTAILSPEVLKLCFSKSNSISADLGRLVELLQEMPKCGSESQFCEAAIYLFIYYNQIESQAIQEALLRLSHRKKQTASINSAQQQDNPQIYSIYPDFTNAKEAIAVLREWEAVLEPITRQTLHTLEEAYYNGNIRQPFETEYHFPRHTNLLEKDETFEKFISIVLSVIKYDKKLMCRGKNLKELRTDLIRDFETQFVQYIKTTSLKPITISDTFLPLTLYAVHESKDDCQTFLNEITKKLKVGDIKISDCQQVILVVNRVVRIRCRWHNPYEISSIVQEVIDSIIENPLFMANQAIVYLENIINVIKQDSPEASRYISHDSTLNF